MFNRNWRDDMHRRSCVERQPILASVGVPVPAALVAYWWSAAAMVVVAAAVCMCVMLHRWWRFEVGAHREQAALLHAAEDERDAAEHELVTRGGSPRPRWSRR